MQDVVGNLAQMVGSQHFLIVGHRLVAGVDIRHQGNKVSQQQQPQPDEIDRNGQDQGQPEHTRRKHRAVPDGEPKVFELFGVVLHPVGRPRPQQVDDHDRNELEQIEVHPRPARHVRDLGQDAPIRGRLCRLSRRGKNRRVRTRYRQERREQAVHC